MRSQKVILLSFVLTFLAASSVAYAAEGGHLRLSASDTNLAVGQEIAVNVLVEGAPTIYGADVHLVFDPALLEVVDADTSVPEIQLTPGDFIDANKSFVLQHEVNNEKGTANYALTLLNPAPSVQGNGRLVQITFRAKAEGQATISIAKGLFGTQAGETITPALDGIEIKVTADGGGVLNSVTGSVRETLGSDVAMPRSRIIGIVAVSLLFVIVLGSLGLLGVRLWRKRTG